jgi:hypothetical protein
MQGTSLLKVVKKDKKQEKLTGKIKGKERNFY